MVDISVKVKPDATNFVPKVHVMRIGELAKLSNTPTRSLRYYEEQGLIIPRRLENGYREYDPYLIDRAIQIRGLIDSGVPTKIIALILPCLDKPRGIVPDDIQPELLAILRDERDRMTQRIDFLTRNRDSIANYIEAADSALARRTAGTAA
jgi:DNA-binding transcriptional MerR regulator